MTKEQKEELCKIGEDEFQHLSESYYNLHEKYYKLQQENQQLKSVLNEVRELKKEWLNNIDNETLVFENNTLIEFMNKLHYILGKVGDK